MIALITSLLPVAILILVIVLAWSFIMPKKDSLANRIVEQTVPDVSTVVDKVGPKNMETDTAEQEAVIDNQKQMKEKLTTEEMQMTRQNDAINAAKSKARFTV